MNPWRWLVRTFNVAVYADYRCPKEGCGRTGMSPAFCTRHGIRLQRLPYCDYCGHTLTEQFCEGCGRDRDGKPAQP